MLIDGGTCPVCQDGSYTDEKGGGCPACAPLRATDERWTPLSPSPPLEHVQRAINTAKAGPCAKSKRGVVLWCMKLLDTFAVGWNQPAMGTCDGSDACRAACPRICIHAEQHAILAAYNSFPKWTWAGFNALLHVKVAPRVETMHETRVRLGIPEGQLVPPNAPALFELVPSGLPSCVECSKLIVRSGIADVWLFHAEGWRRYSPTEFHQLTLETLGLPRSTM